MLAFEGEGLVGFCVDADSSLCLVIDGPSHVVCGQRGDGDCTRCTDALCEQHSVFLENPACDGLEIDELTKLFACVQPGTEFRLARSWCVDAGECSGVMRAALGGRYRPLCRPSDCLPLLGGGDEGEEGEESKAGSIHAQVLKLKESSTTHKKGTYYQTSSEARR